MWNAREAFILFSLATCSLTGYVQLYPKETGAISYVHADSNFKAPLYFVPIAHEDDDHVEYGSYSEENGDGNKGEDEVDYYAYPKYKYSYGVHDPHSGDHKSQAEERDGDVVKGYYTIDEPDGTKRIVHYTADDHNGFNAIVEKIGHAVHSVPLKVVLAEPIYPKPVIAEPTYDEYKS